MLRGRGVTSSVIQAAGCPGSGVSARPNALVVLVKTKLLRPAATASSSSVSVPLTVVSTNACLPCEPTCGLCSVAVCRTASTPSMLSRTTARSATDPTTVVCGDGRTSSPVTSNPRSRSTLTRASPRCPSSPSPAPAQQPRRPAYLRWLPHGNAFLRPGRAGSGQSGRPLLVSDGEPAGAGALRRTPADRVGVEVVGTNSPSQRGQVPGARGDLRGRSAGRGRPRGPPTGRGQRLRGQRPRSGRGGLDGRGARPPEGGRRPRAAVGRADP